MREWHVRKPQRGKFRVVLIEWEEEEEAEIRLKILRAGLTLIGHRLHEGLKRYSSLNLRASRVSGI